MNKSYKKILSLIKNIKPDKKPFVIAIDGKAASGKSTLTAYLQDQINAEVIHMDDFFLPIALRTKSRLKEQGGNIHYERFIDEVINHLHHEHFSYKIFDCSIMDFTKEVKIENPKYLIIEGSYALHPKFNHYADLNIFLDIDNETQIKRITKRNDFNKINRFINEWLPMENEYFEHFNIKEKADIIIQIDEIRLNHS